MSVLAAEHLHLTFPKQTVPVLQDINLKIEEGTLTVILGESGCGKTTVGRAIINVLRHVSPDVRRWNLERLRWRLERLDGRLHSRVRWRHPRQQLLVNND